MDTDRHQIPNWRPIPNMSRRVVRSLDIMLRMSVSLGVAYSVFCRVRETEGGSSWEG